MKVRLALLAAVLGGLSCTAAENGSIALIWNSDDPDPFAEADAAAPTSIAISDISVEAADGGSSGDAATVLVEGPYEAGSTLSLPGQDSFDVDILQATAFDSDNDPIIFGRTVPVELAGIQNGTLSIFVQRTGQFARLPSSFATTPASPLAVTLVNQYIMVADGSGKKGATTNAIYDMNAWAPIQSPLPLPCAPLSIAPLGGTLLLLLCEADTIRAGVTGCSGSGVIACAFDASGVVATQTQSAAGLPAGCGYADVAGGSTVVAPNGDAFLVGGTRPATGRGPTQCVLRVGQSQTTADGGFVSAPVTAGTLVAKRQGAVATWSSMLGLVVAGGNQSVSDPPVEYLSDGDAGTLPAPASPTGYTTGDFAQGSGAAIFEAGKTLVLAGGTLPDESLAGIRIFTLGGCSGECNPEAESDAGSDAGEEAGADADEDASADAGFEDDAGGDAGEDGGEEGGPAGAGAPSQVPLGSAQGFAVGASSALFVGAAGARPGGDTRAFLVSISGTSVTGVTGVPLRVPTRTGTTAIFSPVGSVVVVGGDTTIESFVP